MQSLMPPVDAPNNEFSDGNPSLGTLGTIVRALFLNNVQDAIRSVQHELLSILAAANINPDGDSNNQVLQAINKIMVDSNMSVPYGIPLPWPTSTPPTGYLICNGASFSAATYPNLAAVYTGGSLPDLRGQTIKGLPASGRALLSLEGDGNKSHTHNASASATDLGTKTTSNNGDHSHSWGSGMQKQGVAIRKWVAIVAMVSGQRQQLVRIPMMLFWVRTLTRLLSMLLVIQKPRLKTWHFIIL